jgi:biotin synthase-related radical SAM superfamily protein
MRELPKELLDAIATLPLPMRKQYAAARFAHAWTASKYEAEIDELKAKLAKAVEVLKDLEWHADYHEYRCSMCNHPNPNHDPDCALAAVIKENES